MTKWMDVVYRNSIWILISILLIGYFFYRTMSFTGSIEEVLRDWRTWVHMAFVIFLQITMVSGAYDFGNNIGLTSEEFELADKLNNKIVTSVNNEMGDFRKYIKKLNEHELQSIREDYLFSIGDKTVYDLTKKEQKAYDKLKPIQHNIYGFNLPLYYEMTRNGKIEYKAAIRKNEGKMSKQVQRMFIGVIFGAMTINVMFAWANVWDAFVSVLVIASGLLATFILIFFPQVWKFKFELPKKVMLKNTLYNSYIQFKHGTHVLKELVLGKVTEQEKTALDETPDEEPEKQEAKPDPVPV